MLGEIVGIGMLLFWLLFMVIGVLGTIFWIFMIIDAAKRQYAKEDEKILWILVVVLAGLIGAIVYYFVVKNKK